MIVKTVTASAPTGATVTLGQLAADGANLVGYTLTASVADPAPVESNQTNLPLVTGGVVSGGRQGLREVLLEGFIIANSADQANALRRALIGVFTDHGEAEEITVTYTLEGQARSLAGLVSQGPEFEPAGGFYLRYRVGLVCGDPVAKATTPSSAMAGVLPGVSMTNAGDARVWPTITVTFLAAVTSLRIGNGSTGQYLQLNGISANVGSVLSIDTRPGYELVTLNGVSILDKIAAGSRFWFMKPGANLVYCTDLTSVGADNARATVEWRSGWVS